jgi:hypothetical protein
MKTMMRVGAALALLACAGTVMAEGEEPLQPAGPVGASSGNKLATNLYVAGGVTLLAGGIIAAVVLGGSSHNGSGNQGTTGTTGTTGTH